MKKALKRLIWILFPNIKNTIKKREKLFKKYSYASSNYIANFGGAWGARETMPKEIFGVGRKKTFDGIEVIIPEKYDEYLTRLYGDYMTPPPECEQGGHDLQLGEIEWKI